mgnify:CR=1 FL=1
MAKLKTHQATAKRFRFTKRGHILKKRAGQDHFNAREPGKVTRNKRRLQRVAKVDLRKIRAMVPYA